MWAAHGGFGAEERNGLAFEGVQSMLPPNVLCWHKDYFMFKTIEKKQTQENLSALPLSTRKSKTVLNPQEKTPGAYQPKDDPRRIYIGNLAKTALSLH